MLPCRRPCLEAVPNAMPKAIPDVALLCRCQHGSHDEYEVHHYHFTALGMALSTALTKQCDASLCLVEAILEAMPKAIPTSTKRVTRRTCRIRVWSGRNLPKASSTALGMASSTDSRPCQRMLWKVASLGWPDSNSAGPSGYSEFI
jgi:hypothetical protein